MDLPYFVSLFISWWRNCCFWKGLKERAGPDPEHAHRHACTEALNHPKADGQRALCVHGSSGLVSTLILEHSSWCWWERQRKWFQGVGMVKDPLGTRGSASCAVQPRSHQSSWVRLSGLWSKTVWAYIVVPLPSGWPWFLVPQFFF